jgi:hypothetical protein
MRDFAQFVEQQKDPERVWWRHILALVDESPVVYAVVRVWADGGLTDAQLPLQLAVVLGQQNKNLLDIAQQLAACAPPPTLVVQVPTKDLAGEVRRAAKEGRFVAPGEVQQNYNFEQMFGHQPGEEDAPK